ncbi:hypothetical protein [Luteibacter yeojuensis]|uniref:Uncharacterized protein n=1 Tax=Luteibacter yeojuensis TaxID=345309 RepID=A0A7X5QXJ9_9GAMM|nr:hypothetical protein [Luteibacter yeojuensis]NID17181.1 hypothetical protein [Luteibacter yeojuensis]
MLQGCSKLEPHRAYGIWHGGRLVIALRRMIGWASWLAVATFLYSMAWIRLDEDFVLAFPPALYGRLEALMGLTSHDARENLAIWFTSLYAVLVLHAIAWIAMVRLKPKSEHRASVWNLWKGRLYATVGWTCWWIVSVMGTHLAGEIIYEARGGTLSNDSDVLNQELAAAIVLVVLLHLAGVGLAHLVETATARIARWFRSSCT